MKEIQKPTTMTNKMYVIFLLYDLAIVERGTYDEKRFRISIYENEEFRETTKKTKNNDKICIEYM